MLNSFGAQPIAIFIKGYANAQGLGARATAGLKRYGKAQWLQNQNPWQGTKVMARVRDPVAQQMAALNDLAAQPMARLGCLSTQPMAGRLKGLGMQPSVGLRNHARAQGSRVATHGKGLGADTGRSRGSVSSPRVRERSRWQISGVQGCCPW